MPRHMVLAWLAIPDNRVKHANALTSWNNLETRKETQKVIHSGHYFKPWIGSKSEGCNMSCFVGLRAGMSA